MGNYPQHKGTQILSPFQIRKQLRFVKKKDRRCSSTRRPKVERSNHQSTAIVKQRCLTTDDYLKAAAIVAGCRNERMPYVLGFLRQAGFSVPEVQNRRRELGGELMQVLNEATNVHGFSTRQLGALTGIDFGTISAYRRGRYRPNETRAEYIIQIVRRAMEDRVNERP